MSTPEILHQNLLNIAQAGRGDGTIYATATSAAVDQSAKTLTLTGLSIMTDLGADGNDKFNGYTIYFPASERGYLITDWTAAVATVFEYPNILDTTACQILRTLYTDDFNVANPIRYGSNGQLEKKWIDKAANNTAVGINKDRYVLYNRSPETLSMGIPVQFTMLNPDTSNQLMWQQPAYGQYSGVLINRKREVLYLDETTPAT